MNFSYGWWWCQLWEAFSLLHLYGLWRVGPTPHTLARGSLVGWLLRVVCHLLKAVSLLRLYGTWKVHHTLWRVTVIPLLIPLLITPFSFQNLPPPCLRGGGGGGGRKKRKNSFLLLDSRPYTLARVFQAVVCWLSKDFSFQHLGNRLGCDTFARRNPPFRVAVRQHETTP